MPKNSRKKCVPPKSEDMDETVSIIRMPKTEKINDPTPFIKDGPRPRLILFIKTPHFGII